MPRYARQRDKYKCGPVFVVNTVKWAGGFCTLALDLRRLVRVAKCRSDVPKCEICGNKHKGTNSINLDRVLRKEGKRLFRVKKVNNISINKLENHIRNGGAVGLLFLYTNHAGQRVGHYMLFVDVTHSGKTFTVVNYNNRSVTRIRRSKVIHHLRARKRLCYSGWYPSAWFFARLNK